MRYKLIEKPIPGNPDAPKKWYASPINKGTIKHYRLCKEIAEQTKLTVADVSNVLSHYLEAIPAYLLKGYSVNMEHFATLRISLTSEGTDFAKDFKPMHIKQLKIIITPDTEIKKRMKQEKLEQETQNRIEKKQNHENLQLAHEF